MSKLQIDELRSAFLHSACPLNCVDDLAGTKLRICSTMVMIIT